MRHVSTFLAREAAYNRRVVDDRVFRALATQFADCFWTASSSARAVL